jgi:two-component system, OmpR family, sensor histidine kinase KdpD
MKSSNFFLRFWQYCFAFLLICLTTTLFFVLRDILDTTLIALLYLIPLGVITAFWGLGPGIGSALLSFLAFNYFFISPYYTLAVHRSTDIVILVVFLVVAIVISQLMGRMRASLAAATAREREAIQLYELNTVLASLVDEHAIAETLAKQVQTVLKGEALELEIKGPAPFTLRLPVAHMPVRSPELTLPMQVASDTLGELRLWKVSPAIPQDEKRLLQTFASQGSQALERVRLAEAGSRAKVLEDSDKLKSALLSSVSHELRTPLSTIKAAASSLRSKEVGWDSHARPELIAAIDDEADHLNMLVGNLLDMSRIESGAFRPQREWNFLPEIIESVLGNMKHLMEGYRLEVDMPEDLPLVPVDFVQMEQVFRNLFSNSVKYAPAGTVVRVHASVEGEAIHVVVSNQGPQVPPEFLERIFDKFFRITAADRVTGTGLGLSICKGVIEAHGGRIWAENVADGMRFNFTIPLLLEGEPPPQLNMETE